MEDASDIHYQENGDRGKRKRDSYVPAPPLPPPQTGMVDYCDRYILYLCNFVVCAKNNFYGRRCYLSFTKTIMNKEIISSIKDEEAES